MNNFRSAMNHVNKVMNDLFRDDFGDDISRENYEANRRTKEMFNDGGVKMRKVITPEQVTDISEYGDIINEQADMIQDQYMIIKDLKRRLEYLEDYIHKEEKRRTFKKFVVIASSGECLAVLTHEFECAHPNDIVHVNSSMDNVVYYRLKEEVLANGEVVFITRDFYEKWKRGKKHTVVTLPELTLKISEGSLNGDLVF